MNDKKPQNFAAFLFPSLKCYLIVNFMFTYCENKSFM